MAKFDWEVARDIARVSARKIARSYPGIDPDDIEQAILTRVAEQLGTFKRIGYTPEAMAGIFRQYGVKYANDERVAAYNFSDQYHYTAREVRALCGKALFDKEAFYASVENDPETVTRFDEIIARVVDLQAAYADLGVSEQELLRRRFLLGETLEPSDTKRLQRAIDRLALRINVGRSKRRSTHDGPGARTVVSNATAQITTSMTAEGITPAVRL